MATVVINTPLNVPINFELAGLDNRIGAWFIDAVVRIIIIAITSYIARSIFLPEFSYDSEYYETREAIRTFSWLPAYFYFLLFEIFANGQSIGKKLLKIRVVSIEGYKPTITQYLIRWVMRIIDVSVISLAALGQAGLLTAWYGWGFGILAIFGLVYVIRSDKQQRLGDAAAGTVLIKLKSNLALSDTIFENVHSNYEVTYKKVMKLSDRDITIIKKALVSYEKSGIDTSLWLITEKLEPLLEITNTTDPYILLKTVLRDYNYLSTN